MENENKNTENLESNEEDLVSGGHAFEGGPSEKSCRKVGITKKFHPFKKDEYFDKNGAQLSKSQAKGMVILKDMIDEKHKLNSISKHPGQYGLDELDYIDLD